MAEKQYVTALSIAISMRDGSTGDVIEDPAVFVNDENEVKIFFSYGIEGTYAEVCLYVKSQKVWENSPPAIGDPMKVTINGVETIEFKMVDIRLSEPDTPDGDWCIRITGEPPLYTVMCSLQYDGTADMPKRQRLGATLQSIISTAVKNGGGYGLDTASILSVTKNSSKRTFDHVFTFNESLAVLLDNVAKDEGLEYYYHGKKPVIRIGSIAAIDEDDDVVGVEDTTISGGKFIRYRAMSPSGDMITVIDAVMQGGTPILPGNGVRMSDGSIWKAVKGTYYANGNGERQCHVKMIDTKVTCDNQLLAIFNDDATQKGYNIVGDSVKIGETILGATKGKSGSRITDPGRLKARILPKKTIDQDMAAMEYGVMIGKVTRTTPFAGNGVGLVFPKIESSISLIFSPGGNRSYSYAGPMTWKTGDKKDTVPKCNDDDFLLRLKDGELYFDAANKTWVLRSGKMLLDCKDPAAATSNPSTTAGSASILFESTGNKITIKGGGRTITMESSVVNVT